MKTILYMRYILFLVLAVSFASCEDWLEQEDPSALSPNQAYSTISGINSIAANLYSRIHLDQDFNTDPGSYDLTRWDEAINNSAYWAWAGNVGNNYRSVGFYGGANVPNLNGYDYTYIRNINEHITQLEQAEITFSEAQRAYFISEARFLRAMAYFDLVSRLGGVPIITEVFDYTDTPLDLAKPRNSESEVYDFIINEIDAIVDDLDVSASVKTRVTKGAALALKNRASLYAGSLSYFYSQSSYKGLILPSGATGIPAELAINYLTACLESYEAIEGTGQYALYNNNPDLAANYYEVFTNKGNNQEMIFYKDYDGSTTYPNHFTGRAIPRSQRAADNTGSQINPVLNIASSYEIVSTHEQQPFDAYVGDEVKEDMGETTSNLSYNLYTRPEDIFEGRDPRLSGTVLYPGSIFRGKTLDLQAGLAVKTASGYDFVSVPLIEDVNSEDKGYYEGRRITGIDGPHRISTYVSHTGFLLRKFVDETSGSEASGQSTVPYTVFRYGEVLLNAAEAAFLLHQKGIASYNGKATIDIALECINRIRMRAGGADFAISQAELDFPRIINERRVELSYEGHRYYDLKRWRLADEIWNGNRNNDQAVMFALWPYRVYAPGDADDGKWLYRRLKVEHRGNDADKGMPIYFGLGMYYSTYPITDGNPLIEKNPNH